MPPALRQTKTTIPIDTESLAALQLPDDKPWDVTLIAELPAHQLTAKVSVKSVREAQATLTEYGPTQCVAVIEGWLDIGDFITPGPKPVLDASLLVQPYGKLPHAIDVSLGAPASGAPIVGAY